MERIRETDCEWGVNAEGAVLAAVPSFSASVQEVRVDGRTAVFHHDWFRRTAVEMPPDVAAALAAQPTLLLVQFEAGRDPRESDVPVRTV